MGPERPDLSEKGSGASQEPVDQSTAPVEASEAISVSLLSPERRAEVMEQIGVEEERLRKGVQSNVASLDAARLRSTNPSQTESGRLVMTARIHEAYEAASNQIDKTLMTWFGMGALTAAPGLLSRAYTSELGTNLGLQEMGADFYNVIGEKLLYGGVAIAGAAIAVAAINSIRNMLQRQKQLEQPA